ncbi:MAG: hypothetical protein LBT60_04610, partial [Oscillospiraceae bacterium]|nr:hypothetical protein [Oscillospiraceae bacterium]
MKRNVVLRVAGYQFKKLGVSTLCFLGIYGLGLTALEIVLAALGEPEVLAVTDHLPMVARIFVIVMGIVSPLVYAGPYLAVGVTRRQFAAGFMLAGVGLLLGFSLLFLAI